MPFPVLLRALALVLLMVGNTSARAQPFARQIAPFPVADSTGAAYAFPFLGGFNNPRPQFADIDADGDLDLFVQERAGRVMFFENTGTPSAPQLAFRTAHFRSLDVDEWFRFADADGDGDLDLFAEAPVSRIRYFRNDGSPEEPQFTRAADPLLDASGEVIFADRQNIPALTALDCEGPPDLVLGLISGRVAFYAFDGLADGVPAYRLVSGTFQDLCIGPPSVCGGAAAEAAQPRHALHGANAVAAADLDQDGDPDFLWGDFFSPSLYLIKNAGTCAAPHLTLASDTFPLQNPIRTSGYNAPAPADIDADGDLDLFTGVLGGSFGGARDAVENFFFFENENGRYVLRTRRFLDMIDVGRASVPAATDLDDDGDLDLVVGSEEGPAGGSARLVVFENTGTPAQPAFRERPADGRFDALEDGLSYAPAFADVDADGDPDLALGAFQGLTLYLNEGGAFTAEGAPALETLGGNFFAPAFADVDADGDFDLVVGKSDGALALFRNVGTPHAPRFALEAEAWAGGLDAGTRSRPALHDADADGDLDLYVGTQDAGVVFYRNAGTPEAPQFVRNDAALALDAPPAAAPAFADLDGDGAADLFLGNRSGGLFFYQNEAEGHMPPQAEEPRVVAVPNPFRTATTLAFTLAAPAEVRLVVYDVLGREVTVLADGTRSAGEQRFRFRAGALPSGVYLYALTVDGERADAGSVVLVR